MIIFQEVSLCFRQQWKGEQHTQHLTMAPMYQVLSSDHVLCYIFMCVCVCPLGFLVRKTDMALQTCSVLSSLYYYGLVSG